MQNRLASSFFSTDSFLSTIRSFIFLFICMIPTFVFMNQVFMQVGTPTFVLEFRSGRLPTLCMWYATFSYYIYRLPTLCMCYAMFYYIDECWWPLQATQLPDVVMLTCISWEISQSPRVVNSFRTSSGLAPNWNVSAEMKRNWQL